MFHVSEDCRCSLVLLVQNVQCDYMYMYVLFELVYYPWLLVHIVHVYVTLLYCCYPIQYKQSPVWMAAVHGHVGTLSVLIRAKADVNAANVVSLIFILHIMPWWAGALEAYCSRRRVCVCNSVPPIS